jgi:hypothetical protein
MEDNRVDRERHLSTIVLSVRKIVVPKVRMSPNSGNRNDNG